MKARQYRAEVVWDGERWVPVVPRAVRWWFVVLSVGLGMVWAALAGGMALGLVRSGWPYLVQMAVAVGWLAFCLVGYIISWQRAVVWVERWPR